MPGPQRRDRGSWRSGRVAGASAFQALLVAVSLAAGLLGRSSEAVGQLPGTEGPTGLPERPGLIGEEVRRLPGIWREGRNPAGLEASGLQETGWFRVDLGGEGGSWRRARDPRAIRRLRLETGGDRALGPWRTEGRLSFTQASHEGIRWSSVAAPYAGTPYVWADSTGGDWLRSDVVLGGWVGHRRGGGSRAGGVERPGEEDESSHDSALRFGIGFEAAWGQGARRSDPRPLYRIRDLRLLPGVAWEGAAGTLGLALEITGVLEEGEIGFFAGDDPFVYRQRGFGTFDRTQLVRAVRTREGLRTGLGVQGMRTVSSGTLVAAGWFVIHEDSIRQGIANPVPGGRFRRGEASFRGTLETPGGASMALAAYSTRGEGTDPVFQAINVEIQSRSVEAEGSIPWRGDVVPHARMGLRQEMREDLAAGTRWSALRAHLEAGVEGGTTGPGAGARQRSLSSDVRGLRDPSERTADGPRPGHAWQWSVRGGLAIPVRDSFEADRPTLLTSRVVQPDFHHARDAIGWLGGAVSLEGRSGRLTLRGDHGRRLGLWEGATEPLHLPPDPNARSLPRGGRTSLTLSVTLFPGES